MSTFRFFFSSCIFALSLRTFHAMNIKREEREKVRQIPTHSHTETLCKSTLNCSSSKFNIFIIIAIRCALSAYVLYSIRMVWCLGVCIEKHEMHLRHCYLCIWLEMKFASSCFSATINSQRISNASTETHSHTQTHNQTQVMR